MTGVRTQDEVRQPSITSFEDLAVYRRAYAIALEIHKATLRFPREEQFALADQTRRASKSICANIAEGFAKQRRSSAEYRRYLLMAIGSADEMRVWIRFSMDLDYVEKATAMRWNDEYVEIARMLSGLYSKWNAVRATRSPDA